MRPGILRIFTTLVGKPEGLTFTELKKATGLSPPVVSDYLVRMQGEGVVTREPETRRYCLARFHRPMDAIGDDFQKALKILSVVVARDGLAISEMQEGEPRREAFRLFLDYAFQYLTLSAWKVIRDAVAGPSGRGSIEDQELVVGMNAAINGGFGDWVVPFANSIAVAIAPNSDIIEVGDRLFDTILKQATENLDKLREIEQDSK